VLRESPESDLIKTRPGARHAQGSADDLPAQERKQGHEDRFSCGFFYLAHAFLRSELCLINGQLYNTGLPIQVNSTYLLRATDRRSSDVLVAFRVVREDVDGSVTLAWKLLKEFKPTKIENVLYVNNTDRCPAN